MAKNKNKIRRSVGENAFNAFNIVFMVFMCIITLYPFLYVIFASLSSPAKLMAHSGLMFAPVGFSTKAYTTVLNNPRIWSGYGNTIFYVVAGTCVNIMMTIVAAYGLSRKNCMLNRYITMMIVFTMYFSGGLIPSYLLIRNLGLMDTRWALILPGAISTYNMIIMRTAMSAVPDSLEESAVLDGASKLTVLVRIMIPLTLPTIAVLVLYYGVAHWNSWFSAAIYLQRSPEKHPLQLYLRQILISSQMGEMVGSASDDQEMLAETLKYATIVIATVPILLLYPFLQKYFVKGVMVGSLKG